MPEFWTWWMENGPTMSTLSPKPKRAPDDPFRHLVGDDRRDRHDDQREPLEADPAASERSALEMGCSAFAVDPTRMSTRVGSVRAGSLTCASRTLVVIAEGGVRDCSSRASSMTRPHTEQVP